jgi:histidinol phosphatase-like enzyme (inositol monophosphatase family)
MPVAPTPQLQSRLELAIRAACEAGEITLRYFRRPDLTVDRKEDSSPVTAADRDAEQLLRQRIANAFPDDAILGEEFGETPGTNAFQWTIDPIDGTKSFVAGVPLYTTVIGILEHGQSAAGLIFAPATREMVYASVGGGAWFVDGNAPPRPARVSSIGTLADGLLLTTEVKSFTRYRQRDALPLFVELQREARLTRTWGDAYGYLLVATGRADAMIDPALNLWDAAPLPAILDEAGGRFTDWKGERTVHSGEGIGTNRRLHQAMLAHTQGW